MIRTFIEVPLFSKRWKEIGLGEEELRALQIMLLKDPESGPVMEGTGGIRKVRFPLKNRGKSGSIRVCYTDFAEYEVTYLITAFEKKDQENLSVLVHRDRFAQHFPLAVRVRDVFGEEQMYRFQFRNVDRVFRLSYLHVGNQVRELYEQDVGQYLPAFRCEHGETFFCVLEMLDQLLAFHRKLVLGLLLAVVKPDDILRYVSKLVVGKDIFVLRYAVFLHVQGEVAQLRDRPPDAEREAGEDEEKYQRHQRHKIDEILVDRQYALCVRVPGEGGAVDIPADIRRRVEIALAGRVGRTDGEPFIVEACLAYLAAVVMVVEFLGTAIVEQHFPCRIDNGHAKILLGDVVDKLVNHLVDILSLLRAAEQLVVVIPQHVVQLLLGKLPFPLILEQQEASREPQEHGEYRPEKSLAERYSAVCR